MAFHVTITDQPRFQFIHFNFLFQKLFSLPTSNLIFFYLFIANFLNLNEFVFILEDNVYCYYYYSMNCGIFELKCFLMGFYFVQFTYDIIQIWFRS